MKNKIRTLEDLRAEKRMLRLEIEATEKLIGQALHISDDHLLGGVVDSFFSLVKRDPLEADDFSRVMALPDERSSGWWRKIMPFIPLVVKLSGYLFDIQKAKKVKKAKHKKGEVVLHRAAS